MTLHREAVHDFKGTAAAGVLHVLIDELVGGLFWFKLSDIALQLSIVCVNRIDS